MCYVRSLWMLVQHNDKTPEMNNNSGKVKSSLPGTEGCNHLPPPHVCHHVLNVIGSAKFWFKLFNYSKLYTEHIFLQDWENTGSWCGASRQVSLNPLTVSEMAKNHMFSIHMSSLLLSPSLSRSIVLCVCMYVLVPVFHHVLIFMVN